MNSPKNEECRSKLICCYDVNFENLENLSCKYHCKYIILVMNEANTTDRSNKYWLKHCLILFIQVIFMIVSCHHDFLLRGAKRWQLYGHFYFAIEMLSSRSPTLPCCERWLTCFALWSILFGWTGNFMECFFKGKGLGGE